MLPTTVRPKEDQNFWNFLFSIFFLLVLVVALWLMRKERGGFLGAVSVFDTVLLVFASFRITRLIVYDKITRWFRELFASKHEFEKDGVIYVEVVPFSSGFRHTIYDLLQCPWCIGIWSALIVVVCYYIFDWAWTVIFFLALAGAGTLLQLLASLLGWQAENHKLDAHAKGKAGHLSDRSGL